MDGVEDGSKSAPAVQSAAETDLHLSSMDFT